LQGEERGGGKVNIFSFCLKKKKAPPQIRRGKGRGPPVSGLHILRPRRGKRKGRGKRIPLPRTSAMRQRKKGNGGKGCLHGADFTVKKKKKGRQFEPEKKSATPSIEEKRKKKKEEKKGETLLWALLARREKKKTKKKKKGKAHTGAASQENSREGLGFSLTEKESRKTRLS